jgi:hypothetical protein
MAPAPQPLQRVIASDATLAAWNARIRQETALTELLRRHVPRPLADRFRVTDTKNGELTIAVEAGAIASVLRQRTPDLLNVLYREGLKFSAIRIRVQVRENPPVRTKLARDQIDRTDLQPLAKLARNLPSGPLKESLGRLLRRIG